ncbi:cobyrinate a,c-diamide synthase [Gemmatimonadota bacterium]
MSVPRILIAGLRGGGGKTLISLGLIAAWREQGHSVAPFKKGPDYIDAAWLSSAAARPCRNLDLFLHSPDTVLHSFHSNTVDADVAVIEGNRGLFDGMDARGSYSSAELAKVLTTPVVLAVDCTKATRTIAALVLGCQQLDPLVSIRGVILNRTAGTRHQSVITAAIEETCGLSVLGAIPRLPLEAFPERHLGLVPPQEHAGEDSALGTAAAIARDNLDLDALWSVAHSAPALNAAKGGPATEPTSPGEEEVRIGVFRDAAFQFYYPENLEALQREGAELVEVSPLSDAELPEGLDALYLGGGFPETLAPALAENASFKESLRRAVDTGLPVYAECGGAVYLGQRLHYEGSEYAMAGVLPVGFGFRTKPQGHGYTEVETVADNPFFEVGESMRGHEFHYTHVEASGAEELSYAFKVRRGHGFDGERDGLCHGSVLASYTHLHALGSRQWAPALVRAASRFHSIERRATGSGP